MPRTYVAPRDRSSFSCSGLRTILTVGISSFWQSLTNIWPRFDAAAVCTSPECPSRRMVSVIPRAVTGLTEDGAPSRAMAPLGRTTLPRLSWDYVRRRRTDSPKPRSHVEQICSTFVA
jgi:hypothetical protein